MSDPLFSVILPTYNRAAQLQEAIQSVLHQTFEEFELLVVDDASTDDTQKVIERIDGVRVRYLLHSTNRGASAARNTGIREAQGDFLAFLDSDDRWHPTKLEKQVEKLRRVPSEVGVIYCGTRTLNRNPRETPGIVPEKRGDIYEDQLARDWIAGTPTWLVRRECFKEVGGFNEDLPARNDYEMSIRLAEHYHFDFVPEPLVEVGTSSDNRLTQNVEVRLQSHETIIEEVVRPRLEDFSESKRHKILATQYFFGGRFAQRNDYHYAALSWFKRSLRHQIMAPKTWGAFLLAVLGRDLPQLYYRWKYQGQDEGS